MPPIVTSAEIDRPAPEVFAYATDPSRFSEWQKGVVDRRLRKGASNARNRRSGAAVAKNSVAFFD
jgi:uncharacterized protein YndB with AHSA1/START domain